MVHIRKKNIDFVTKKFCILSVFTFRALGVESPRGGAIAGARSAAAAAAEGEGSRWSARSRQPWWARICLAAL